MLDIVAEAIAFYNETRSEQVFHLTSILTWGYVLGPVNQEQVGPATAALGKLGFSGVKAIMQEEGQRQFEIHVSELRVHTADSFAARVKGLAEFARQNGFQILDWSVDIDWDPETDQTGEGRAGSPAPEVAGDRIVEVYAAADAVEAHALCALLEDAGIQAEVVGDVLGNARGALPLGVATAPRIWVRAAEAAEARQIIAECTQGSPAAEIEWPDDDQWTEEEESAGEDATPLPSDRHFAFLSQGFYIVGLVCVLFGSMQAWQSWTILQTRGTAEAHLVDTYNDQSYVPPEHKPLVRSRSRTRWASYHSDAYYSYTVNGKEYPAVINGVKGAPQSEVTVYYDPQHPESCKIGPIMPPWMIMTFACGIAAFLCFVGYQFRGNGPTGQPPSIDGKSAK